MRRIFLPVLLIALGAAPAWPRSAAARGHILDPVKETLRHRGNLARRPPTARLKADTGPVQALLPDAGNIAVLDDADGVSTPAGFDLDQRSLQFQPAGTNASQYSFSAGASRFDADAIRSATALRLQDDDATQLNLPFSFPFYGQRYNSLFVHSDGNISFNEPEASSFERDFVRLAVGPPRMAPLFIDLDPSQPEAAVSHVSGPSRFLVTWNNVPLYGENPGPGVPRQSFQAALYPDGRIEFSYRGVNVTSAVVGIAPGGATRIEQISFVDFSAASTTTYSAAIVEDFIDEPQFDFIALGEKFYRNHEDPYDFLVIFDTVDRDLTGCAFALRIRNWVRGIGIRAQGIAEEFDVSSVVGSAGRLQTLIYMGPVNRYPADPAEFLPLTSACGRNSVLTILGQEAGHRFLAFPRFIDPETGQRSSELLGRDLAHWSFFFNSDASVMEGNQIEDKGAGVSPRFETKEIVQRYGALDQYLMGLRALEEVPTTFFVRQPSIDFPRSRNPQSGLFFDGTRVDVTAPMIVAAEGRRAPDHTLSPKQFRFAFLLLLRAGATPAQADIDRLERIRTEWEGYFRRAVDNRARAETRLVKQLQLSVWPASGLLLGRTVTATLTLGAAAPSAVTVNLAASSGAISVPASVTVPAGRRTVEFSIAASSAGTAELTAEAAGDAYETARASLQVRPSAAGLRLEQLGGLLLSLGLVLPGSQLLSNGGLGTPLGEELIFRVRDENFLPYPGLRLNVTPSGTGTITPSPVTTDGRGWARLKWNLDAAPGPNTLRVTLDGQPEITAEARAVGVPHPPRHRDVRPLVDPVP